MAIDQVLGAEASEAQGGAQTIRLVGRSLDAAEAAREATLKAEKRARAHRGWRDHYRRKWRLAEDRIAGLLADNRAAWEAAELRLNVAYGLAALVVVLGFTTIILALTLYKSVGGG